MKILISLMLAMSFFVVSCGVEDDNSCVNEDEERIIPCATDNTKEQKQICHQGEWIDEGFCYLCEEYSTRTITCATDETRDQVQKCYLGDWVDEGLCLCPKDDAFCHFHDGLNWSDKSSNQIELWHLVEYCEDLGGRLPTINELRTLIQNCPTTEAGGECRITDTCVSYDCKDDSCHGCESDQSGKYSIFGDVGNFWSSTEMPDFTYNVWTVSFNNASIFSENGNYPQYFRCVK